MEYLIYTNQSGLSQEAYLLLLLLFLLSLIRCWRQSGSVSGCVVEGTILSYILLVLVLSECRLSMPTKMYPEMVVTRQLMVDQLFISCLRSIKIRLLSLRDNYCPQVRCSYTIPSWVLMNWYIYVVSVMLSCSASRQTDHELFPC